MRNDWKKGVKREDAKAQRSDAKDGSLWVASLRPQIDARKMFGGVEGRMKGGIWACTGRVRATRFG